MYEGISASAISCWLLLDNVVAHFAFSPDYTLKREKGKNTSTNDDDAHFKHTIEIDIVLHTYIPYTP